MILAGDIGGTNTRLGLFEPEGESLKPVVIEVFPSGDFKSLREIVERFVSMHRQTVDHACFGVAGPIRDGMSETSNLPWVVDSRKLAGLLSLTKVELINDVEANAHGIPLLHADDFVVLNEGSPNKSGNQVLISAGTGLGEAGLHWEGTHHQPFACEGGHTDFAPRNELEMELLSYLLNRYEHVSYERVVSGPGLFNIYEFLRDARRGDESEWLKEQLAHGDPPAVIMQAALAGKCELCVRALDLFVSIYGAEAGNLALKVMATGGVFLGGGIAPRIVRKLQGAAFMEAFVAKGRMRPLLESVPVRAIVRDKTALLGAARVAQLGVRLGHDHCTDEMTK